MLAPITSELDTLCRVLWITAIPLSLLLGLVLYKALFLMHQANDFITVTQKELTPTIQELRLSLRHLEKLSAKALTQVEVVEHNMQQSINNAQPFIDKGIQLADFAMNTFRGNGAWLVGRALWGIGKQLFIKKKGPSGF